MHANSISTAAEAVKSSELGSFRGGNETALAQPLYVLSRMEHEQTHDSLRPLLIGLKGRCLISLCPWGVVFGHRQTK